MTNEGFHSKYSHLIGKSISLTLKTGEVLIGVFNDEFLEANAMLLNHRIIDIKDIKNIEPLIEK